MGPCRTLDPSILEANGQGEVDGLQRSDTAMGKGRSLSTSQPLEREIPLKSRRSRRRPRKQFSSKGVLKLREKSPKKGSIANGESEAGGVEASNRGVNGYVNRDREGCKGGKDHCRRK